MLINSDTLNIYFIYNFCSRVLSGEAHLNFMSNLGVSSYAVLLQPARVSHIHNVGTLNLQPTATHHGHNSNHTMSYRCNSCYTLETVDSWLAPGFLWLLMSGPIWLVTWYKWRWWAGLWCPVAAEGPEQT